MYKRQVYTLCGLDTFEIIRKYTGNYAGKAVTEDEKKLYNEYEQQRCTAENLRQKKENIQSDILHLQNKLENLETELLELETAFKNAGGIPAAEKEAVLQESAEAGRIKTEASTRIKLFVEGLMPVSYTHLAVPKSKKLLKFVLDDGSGEDRVILSGIHEYYEPEELVGKTCIAITNLPPRPMMGIDSCGMLISAVHEEDGHEGLNLLMVNDRIPAGAKLY